MATLESIAADIRGHLPCGFEPCETCTNFVPGEGPAPARIMIVGEAPGASEDKQGRPFVGRAGRLLDELLAGVAGLQREDVFITNVLKARPPGNRDPKADEVAHSMPWLERSSRSSSRAYWSRSAATHSSTSRPARRSPRSTARS